jgi:RecA-family ATPase
MAALRAYVLEHDIRLVVLDTLSRFWTDVISEESDNIQVGRSINPFLELARETGAVVLLVHHERKAGGKEGRSIRGGSALFGLVDQALLLERRAGSEREHSASSEP